MIRNSLFVLVVFAGALASLALASGASAGGGSDWVEPGIGAWTEPSNWSPARVPDSSFGDEPTIDNGGTAQVAGATPPTFGVLTVGANNAGILEISAGGTLQSNSFAILGENSGSTGTLNISGTGSSLTLFREMRIGRLGSATILVEAGGTLTSNTSGSVIDTIIAESPGTVGSVTVRGTGSTWHPNDDLRIAMPATGAGGTSGGTATLTIADGGLVSSLGGTLARGADANANVTIQGAGSLWNANGANVFVGSGSFDAPAALVVEQAGRVSARDLLVGQSGGAGNRRVVLGTGGAPGILDVQRVFGGEGGLFLIDHNDPEYWLTRDGTPTGTPVTIAADLRVRHIGPGTTVLAGENEFSGRIDIENGSLIVTGLVFPGQFFFDSTFTVQDGGLLGGDGLVGIVEVAGGIIAPGRSIGTLSTRDLTLDAASTLVIELGAPGVGDRLDADGDLVLDGELEIVDAGGLGDGRYRLIDYQGTLTDNGLTIVSAPSGFGFLIDTSVAGQVDLVVGSGTASALVLPERLEFSNVEVGQFSAPEPVLVTNDGTLPLNIQQVMLAGTGADAYDLTEDLCSGQTLAASESCDLAVTFAPGAVGLRLGRMEILSNDPDSPAAVPLSGYSVVADSLFAESFE